MKIFEIIKLACEKLSEVETPRLDAEILLAYVLNCRRLNLYTDSDRILTQEEITRYMKLIERRAEKIPVAYLIGVKEFFGLNFAVNENVLIPRPDTEILVQCAIEFLQDTDEKIFLDIGTGSGAICVSILKFLRTARAVATDISEKSLEVAKFNAQKFNVDDRAEFLCGDLFATADKKFAAIISNPPYIPTADIKNLQAEVLSEPIKALDGGLDGLNFYRRIISSAEKFLLPRGFLAFEIGINQAAAVKNLLAENNFVEIEILRDLAGLERVICAKQKF